MAWDCMASTSVSNRCHMMEIMTGRKRVPRSHIWFPRGRARFSILPREAPQCPFLSRALCPGANYHACEDIDSFLAFKPGLKRMKELGIASLRDGVCYGTGNFSVFCWPGPGPKTGRRLGSCPLYSCGSTITARC